MTTPSLDAVRAYYDERVEGKLRDFTDSNPRIEAAVQTLAEWAPLNPKRILEIGCGIGATAWRMARAWPQAEVVGADVSSASIQVARTCFRRTNLSFHEGLITQGTLSDQFDLVVLMDTYEHVAEQERSSFHSVIKSLLVEEARVFLSFPTPALQSYGRLHKPSELQPVDEDVKPADIIRLAEETGNQLLYYREVGIWRYGDYAHVVVGRYQNLADVALRKYRPKGVAGFKERVKYLLHCGDQSTGRHDYLGSDVLHASSPNVGDRFKVTAIERRRLASSWFRPSRS